MAGEPSPPLTAGSHRRWSLDRGSSATHQVLRVRSAYQRMINRRLRAAPPALLGCSRAEMLAQQAIEFCCLQLEMANMRVEWAKAAVSVAVTNPLQKEDLKKQLPNGDLATLESEVADLLR